MTELTTLKDYQPRTRPPSRNGKPEDYEFESSALKAIADDESDYGAKCRALDSLTHRIAQQARSRNLVRVVLISALDCINDPDVNLVGFTITDFMQRIGEASLNHQRTSIYRYFDSLPKLIETVLTELAFSPELTDEMLTQKEKALIAYFNIQP